MADGDLRKTSQQITFEAFLRDLMLAGADIRGYGLDLPPSPHKEEASTVFMVVATLLMIAVNVRLFGSIGALVIVALSLAVLYMGRRGLIARLIRQPILIALPCVFVLSTLWSDEMKISLSLGLQTLLTVITAVTVAQCTTDRQFLRILFVATTAVCIGCVLHGGTGYSSKGLVLVGFLGSKDAMGLFAYTAFMTALAIAFDSTSMAWMRITAAVVALAEGYLAASVHATAAVIALVMGLALFLFTHLVLARSKAMRMLSYFIGGILIILLCGFIHELIQMLIGVAGTHLGKDATLTGRTVLWEKAMQLFESAPVLGHGFRAYWVGSSLDARQLLFEMDVTDGRGFHFHQQYLEIMADTGALGLLVFVLTLIVFMKSIWRNVVIQQSSYAAYAFASMAIYYIRYALETAYLPFSFDMMLFYGLAAAAMKLPRMTTVTPQEVSTNTDAFRHKSRRF